MDWKFPRRNAITENLRRIISLRVFLLANLLNLHTADKNWAFFRAKSNLAIIFCPWQQKKKHSSGPWTFGETSKLAHFHFGDEKHNRITIVTLHTENNYWTEIQAKIFFSLLQTLADFVLVEKGRKKNCCKYFFLFCNSTFWTKSAKWILYTRNNKQLSCLLFIPILSLSLTLSCNLCPTYFLFLSLSLSWSLSTFNYYIITHKVAILTWTSNCARSYFIARLPFCFHAERETEKLHSSANCSL